MDNSTAFKEWLDTPEGKRQATGQVESMQAVFAAGQRAGAAAGRRADEPIDGGALAERLAQMDLSKMFDMEKIREALGKLPKTYRG